MCEAELVSRESGKGEVRLRRAERLQVRGRLEKLIGHIDQLGAS